MDGELHELLMIGFDWDWFTILIDLEIRIQQSLTSLWITHEPIPLGSFQII